MDLSVLEALPAELREQVEQSWTKREERPNNFHPLNLYISSPDPRSTSPPHPVPYNPPAGTLVLQIPNQPGSPGIVLELPNFSQVRLKVFEIFVFYSLAQYFKIKWENLRSIGSWFYYEWWPPTSVTRLQVDPDVFAALPKELQEELESAYNRATNIQAQVKTGESTVKSISPLPPRSSLWPKFILSFFCLPAVEQKNPLLQLKQPGVGIGIARVKRRYKRKNGVSPLKKGTSPLKRRQVTNSPSKSIHPPVRPQEPMNVPKVSPSKILTIK